jgi:hypothetical protein
MVDHSVSRILDQIGIHLDADRWSGEMDSSRRSVFAKAEAAIRDGE